MQLPLLKDLQRVIDELAFGVNARQSVATPSRLVVEQVRSVPQQCCVHGALLACMRVQTVA